MIVGPVWCVNWFLSPLRSQILRPGLSRLIVVAKEPKNGNYDDFALDEIKLL